VSSGPVDTASDARSFGASGSNVWVSPRTDSESMRGPLHLLCGYDYGFVGLQPPGRPGEPGGGLAIKWTAPRSFQTS
jgi:hypothetical protein